ncbi:MAG: hypothetical protein B7X30_01025 [Thiomonas sp. 13-64-67]|nr:MAG: hypothetical protein B7X30_01025 [Thiomonas sp. 13-64-67]
MDGKHGRAARWIRRSNLTARSKEMIDLLRGHAARARAWGLRIVLKWVIAPLVCGWLVSYALGGGAFASALGVMAGLALFSWFAWRKVQQWRAPATAGDDLPNVHQAVALGKAMQRPAYRAEPMIEHAEQSKTIWVGATWRHTRKGIARDVPVVLTPDQMRKNHIAILGASGTGKTVITTSLLAQALRMGDAVVVIDPKSDEFAPGILTREARALGRPTVFVDLRADVPQINPFFNASRAELEVLMTTALGLEPSGEPGVDFYRGEDRDGLAALLDAITPEQTTLRGMVAVGAGMSEVTDRANLWRNLKDLARLEALATSQGPDLAAVIEQGGLIYIVGSVDDLRVQAAQKMALTRIVQIIKNRPRTGARHTHLFLDEFKYSLGNTSLRALGTIRDQRATVLLAFQSYGDLHDCAGLPAQAVLGAAKGNTPLKLIFRLEDDQTARELSSLSGQYAVQTETTAKTTNVDGLEQGSYLNTMRSLVTPDMLSTAMPKPASSADAPVCWIFGDGVPKLIACGYMQPGEQPQVTPAPPLPTSSAPDATKAQALI